MRVVVAIAAMVAAPVLALADEPATPTAPVGGSTPAPTAPAPASAPAPAPAEPPTAAPGETPVADPKVDPAYGEKPEYDTRNFAAPRGKDVVVIAYPERTRKSILVMGGLAAGGALFGAVGLYFHLDSRSASNDVSAHENTGVPWSAAKADAYDRAHSSAVTAGVLYGIGGSLLLATAIVYIVTEPEAEKMVIHPHVDDKPSALVAPLPGGAMVGGAWRF
jgi:hypothetical protein